MAADPLALTLLPAPGSFGADICVGSMQRYGVPMGFGGPHAAYMATSEKYARRMPGRIIGAESVSSLNFNFARNRKEEYPRPPLLERTRVDTVSRRRDRRGERPERKSFTHGHADAGATYS